VVSPEKSRDRLERSVLGMTLNSAPVSSRNSYGVPSILIAIQEVIFGMQVLMTESETVWGLCRFLSLPLPRAGLLQLGAKPGGRASTGKVGVTDVNPDPGRPTSQSWHRFPVWVAQAVNAAQHDHCRRGDCLWASSHLGAGGDCKF